ncbi:hypothetical protein JR316_0010689 [Psilocybe cubensis]|uniref:Uncharacterized protein n=2 Tax=Psilocybe cubensis TaxID=181762 RepID=A0ACB8GMS8_PSICU|nr:hypothetical protein JR316_0010689 [Psilocybe cubensis]KAH9476774.1 hypothetical protein JR316_0010689 [Psilocybe cubensis]
MTNILQLSSLIQTRRLLTDRTDPFPSFPVVPQSALPPYIDQKQNIITHSSTNPKMIIDDKVIMYPPPPPYQSPSSPSPSSPYFQSSSRRHPTLTSLPSHILLQIIHHTFPPLTSPTHLPVLPPSSSLSQHQLDQYLYEDSKPSLQRKTLFWMSTSLRLVSRRLYTACMHVLRSTYLPSYNMLIRPPYTSDPFPLTLPTSSNTTSGSGSTPAQPQEQVPTSPVSQFGPPAYSRSTTSLVSQQQVEDTSPLMTIHRETLVLDRFIALKVRQDVFADDSELHIEREDAFRDLFDVEQPRARLEDLVRIEGVRQGVVCMPEVGQSGGRRQERRMYGANMGTGSHSSNSSLASLSSVKTAYMVPQSNSQSQSQTQPSSSTRIHNPPPKPKPKRLFFGLIKGSSPSSPSSPSPSTPPPSAVKETQVEIQPIPFSALSVSFSPRRIGLVLNRSRTIAEVPRLGVGRGKEPLEVLAKGLVRELRSFLEGSR